MSFCLRVESSSLFLPEDGPLKRLPRAPQRKRPDSFWDAFEDRAVFYDCFWNAEGDRIILIGPPALNLASMLEAARFVAEPSRTVLQPSLHPSRSTLIVELAGAQRNDRSIEVELAGERYQLEIRPSLVPHFRGRRVMVTMNRDNDLEWIEGWIRWHQQLHGVDAVVFFDNGSQRYDVGALQETLAGIAGIEVVALVSWPFRYGRKDPAMLTYPHYTHFLQVSSLNVALRRMAAASAGLLNCDIDELVGTAGRGSAFDQLAASRTGIVVLKGNWVETLKTDRQTGDVPHLKYRAVHRNPLLAICADKWIIDPAQAWLSSLDAKPGVHRIYDVPKRISRDAPTLPFWHFRAINTNWKEQRAGENRPQGWFLRFASELDAEIDRYQVRGETSSGTANAATPAAANKNMTFGAS